MLSPDEIAHYRTDLLGFTQHMFQRRKGAPMMHAPFHDRICIALERVVLGQCPRLIINIPPRAGKTDIAVKHFLAWIMGNFPDAENIHVSYSKTLAASNASEVRDIMRHEAFAEIFGPPQFRDDTNAKDHFKTVQGGHVYAVGAEGTITGFGAGKIRPEFGGCIIIDDPHKADDANSDTMRQNVLDWFQNTLESRKNRKETPIIVIMQRLHEDDLSGWLLGGGNGEKWEHLCIPALDDEGVSFWPDNSNFTVEEMRRKEKAGSYVFAGQYMQRPAPIGGGIFKDAWWQYYRQLPEIEWRAIYADTAQKTKEHNDYSVFQCWGTTKDGAKYLLDQIRGKWEAPDLLTQARAFWAKHAAVKNCGSLRAMKVEDKVSGTGLIQTLSRERIPVFGIQRGTDKITRALDAAPMVEAGNVYLPQDAPWLSDFLQEASYFPNGKHDDQLDPMFDAVTDKPPQVSYKAWV